MTELFQCRVDKKLLAKARQVTKDIGTTPGEVVRLMFAQMVKRRAIPFPLNADSPEDEVLGPVKRRVALWDDQSGVQIRRTAKVRIEKRGKYHVGVSDHPINEKAIKVALAQFP
jgi:addiction module RelB/DinJ family antitoxin